MTEHWTLLPPFTEAGEDPDGDDDTVILRGFNGPKVKERVDVVRATEYLEALRKIAQISVLIDQWQGYEDATDDQGASLDSDEAFLYYIADIVRGQS